jgi:hypothetical protein
VTFHVMMFAAIGTGWFGGLFGAMSPIGTNGVPRCPLSAALRGQAEVPRTTVYRRE